MKTSNICGITFILLIMLTFAGISYHLIIISDTFFNINVLFPIIATACNCYLFVAALGEAINRK